MWEVGKTLMIVGGVLCLAGIVTLVLAMFFFGRQRAKLIDQINNEYREAWKVSKWNVRKKLYTVIFAILFIFYSKSIVYAASIGSLL